MREAREKLAALRERLGDTVRRIEALEARRRDRAANLATAAAALARDPAASLSAAGDEERDLRLLLTERDAIERAIQSVRDECNELEGTASALFLADVRPMLAEPLANLRNALAAAFDAAREFQRVKLACERHSYRGLPSDPDAVRALLSVALGHADAVGFTSGGVYQSRLAPRECERWMGELDAAVARLSE